MCATLMYMYRTAKADVYEYFRYEFIQFMLLNRINIEQYIQNIGCKCDVGNTPLYLSIYM